MCLERVGVLLLDGRAALKRLSRLVRVLRIRGPKRSHRLGICRIEGLDELVGGGADGLFVGVTTHRGRRDCWWGGCRRSRRGRFGRLGSDHQACVDDRGQRCSEQQARADTSNRIRGLPHGWLQFVVILRAVGLGSFNRVPNGACRNTGPHGSGIGFQPVNYAVQERVGTRNPWNMTGWKPIPRLLRQAPTGRGSSVPRLPSDAQGVAHAVKRMCHPHAQVNSDGGILGCRSGMARELGLE